MVGLVVVCLGQFVFAGGKLDDAVGEYARYSKAPVVAIAVSADVGRMSFESRTPEEDRVAFGRCLRLSTAGDTASYGPVVLPVPFRLDDWRWEEDYDADFPAMAAGSKWVKDGKIDLETSPKDYLRASDLPSAGFGRRLAIHWLVRRCRLSVRAHGVPEEDFLRQVAYACVSRMVVSEETYRLDLDIERYRKLRIDEALRQAVIRTDRRFYERREELRYRIQAEALRVIPAKDLEEIMKLPNSTKQVLWKPKPISALGMQCAEYMRETLYPSPSGVRRINSVVEHLKSVADVSQTPCVSVMQQGIDVVLIGRKPGTLVSP